MLNLLAVAGLGSGSAVRLVEACGSPQAVFTASDAKLREIKGITDRVIEPLRRAKPDSDPGKRQLEAAQKAGVEIRSYWEENYPPALRDIESDSPVLLFIRGRLAPNAVRVAVVGTRRASAYGKRATDELIGGLRGSGVHVVSGLASGIDGFAHEAALNAELITEAVFGNGVDRIYPASNTDLAKRIMDAGGAHVSEYPMGAPSTKYTFPQRNRIIAGLSRATIIVEAPERSGASITAGLAIEYAREVGAVPGPIHSIFSRGTHELIKTGAALIERPSDILALLKGVQAMDPPAEQPRPLPADLPAEERRIMDALDGTESIHIDFLVEKVGMTMGEILSRLLMLELKGLIKQLPGKYFVRA